MCAKSLQIVYFLRKKVGKPDAQREISELLLYKHKAAYDEMDNVDSTKLGPSISARQYNF